MFQDSSTTGFMLSCSIMCELYTFTTLQNSLHTVPYIEGIGSSKHEFIHVWSLLHNPSSLLSADYSATLKYMSFVFEASDKPSLYCLQTVLQYYMWIIYVFNVTEESADCMKTVCREGSKHEWIHVRNFHFLPHTVCRLFIAQIPISWFRRYCPLQKM